jgi:hypothetical protein
MQEEDSYGDQESGEQEASQKESNDMDPSKSEDNFMIYKTRREPYNSKRQDQSDAHYY